MKDSKMVKALFTLFLMSWSILATAGSNLLPNVVITQVGTEKKVKVTIHDLTSEATITITSPIGGELLNESCAEGTYAKIFNLEQLDPGNYNLIIQTGLKEVAQPFVIEPKTLILNVSDRKEFLNPVINNNAQFVDLTLLNNRVSDVTVTIQNNLGNTVYEDAIKGVVKVEKRYNLSALERGNYRFIVTTPQKTYYKEVVNR